MHREWESRSLEPLAFEILHREKANKIFGKHLARLLKDLHHDLSSVQVWCAAYHRLRRRVLHSVHKSVFVQSALFVFLKSKTQVRTLLFDTFFIMFFEIMILLRLVTSIIELLMLDLIIFMIYLF